jgi:hypothetical protein
MLPYIKVFPDLSETVDLLSDAEAGRLLKSILHYANGEEDELPGQEKLVYAMLRKQIDRDAAEYERYSEKQRANGCKGGRPKKPRETQQNPKNPLVFEKTQKSQEEEKEKEKEKEVVRAPARETAPAAGWMSAEEMDRAAEEYNSLMDAMETIGMPTTAYNTEQVMALKAQYGTDKVLASLKTAAEGDTKGGVSLAFVRAILDGSKKQQTAKKQATRTIRECCVIDGKEVWTERKVAAT